MQEIEQLYVLYGRKVYAYLLGLSGNHDLAAECTQETFCRLLSAIASYRGEARVATWLIGVARNVYREELKRRRKHGEPTADDRLQNHAAGADGPAERRTEPEQYLMDAERRSDIAALLALLPPAHREVLILKEYQGLSHGEIAGIMGQSPNWVRVTYFRAKAHFRDLFRDREENRGV